MLVKVGYIVAYDYELLKHSLPSVYKRADKIVIAIDKNRRTFTGSFFTIEPSFFEWLREVDADRKITVYEDEFYVPDLTANEADTRKRNMLAKQMGEGGWHFQIDVDEYFVDFEGLISELALVDQKLKNRKITLQIYCNVLFKVLDEGFLILDGQPEKFAIATNNPEYTLHRYNERNERYFINHVLLHQSWGRNEDDLLKKLKNWSHHADFDTTSYFNFWKSVNLDNYKYVRDFHPLEGARWECLRFVPANTIEGLLNNMQSKYLVEKPSRLLRLKKWMPPVIYRRLPQKF